MLTATRRTTARTRHSTSYNDDYSRKFEAGFSYRIDENNRVAFGSKYDVDNQSWRKFDYYWFHDMHCSQVIFHYEGRDKTWKVKWRFLPI